MWNYAFKMAYLKRPVKVVVFFTSNTDDEMEKDETKSYLSNLGVLKFCLLPNDETAIRKISFQKKSLFEFQMVLACVCPRDI